jgi:phytoene dehydrogenase-like protein
MDKPDFVPLADGRFLRFGGELTATWAEIARFSAADAHKLPACYAQLDRVAEQLKKLGAAGVPDLGGPLIVQGWNDLISAA